MSIPNQVFIALVVDNFLYPLSAFRSHFSQSINWSGIRYHLKNGKISKVCPFKAKSSSITPMTDLTIIYALNLIFTVKCQDYYTYTVEMKM